MPLGLRREKRLADVIGTVVTVAKITNGEVEGTNGKAPIRTKGTAVGGKARIDSHDSACGVAIERKAAAAR
jgi:hypothetical protein